VGEKKKDNYYKGDLVGKFGTLSVTRERRRLFKGHKLKKKKFGKSQKKKYKDEHFPVPRGEK